MQRSWFLLTPLLFCGCVIDIGTERELVGTFAIDQDKVLRLELPVAEIEIEATDRQDVLVDLRVGCRWRWTECEHAVDDLELSTEVSSRRMLLEIEGLESWQRSMIGIEGVIEIPRNIALEVELGVGELDVVGTTRDTYIDLGIGELRLEMPKAAVGEAFVTVKIGEARLSGTDDWVEDRRSQLVGRRLRWREGSGDSEIDVEVGIGEASVRLD